MLEQTNDLSGYYDLYVDWMIQQGEMIAVTIIVGCDIFPMHKNQRKLELIYEFPLRTTQNNAGTTKL